MGVLRQGSIRLQAPSQRQCTMSSTFGHSQALFEAGKAPLVMAAAVPVPTDLRAT
jgi:hypothetical protein